MFEWRLAQNSSSRCSSTEGDSVRMKGNLPRQVEPRDPKQPQEHIQPQNPVQPQEPAQAPQNPPDVQTVQREFLLSMKEMFDQLLSNLKKENPIAQAIATLS
ncbi:hypothetical protein V6N13_104889 [Hibiscus sabdariffa]